MHYVVSAELPKESYSVDLSNSSRAKYQELEDLVIWAVALLFNLLGIFEKLNKTK